MAERKESICRNCFHSYVCEQFNENKDDNNEKCHFANDHYIPRADVAPKSEVERLTVELDAMRGAANTYKMHYENARKEIERLKDYNTGVAFKHYFDGKAELASEIEIKLREQINDILESINNITDPDAIDGQYEEIATLKRVLNFVAELKKKYSEGEQ